MNVAPAQHKFEAAERSFPNSDSGESAAAPHPIDALQNVATQFTALADAQFGIWKLKMLRMVTLGALMVPLSIALLALTVYGFVLLDRAFAFALDTAGLALWFSPLVRGCLYFGVPALLTWYAWSKMVSCSDHD